MLAGEDGRLHMGAIHAHAAYSARREALEVSLERMPVLYPIPLAESATALAIEAGRVLYFPDVMNGADVLDASSSACRGRGPELLAHRWRR